jgi:pimeloyl-ACP methyl ester carboxylesterase
VAVALGALGGAGIIFLRYVWFGRRRLPAGSVRRALTAATGSELAIAHLRNGHERAVVMAHGLLRSMSDHNMVRMAQALAERFDVLTFDFPGHGASLGEATGSFAHAAEDLRRVIDVARAEGYEQIGVIGYSLGAAAAVLASANGVPVKAVVSVSCPASKPRRTVRVATWPWRWWARLMGTRVAPWMEVGPRPIEQVDGVAPVPLLVVHCGLDTLVSREDSETLFAVARPPKDYLYVPRALHAMPMSAMGEIIAWLERRMPED